MNPIQNDVRFTAKVSDRHLNKEHGVILTALDRWMRINQLSFMLELTMSAPDLGHLRDELARLPPDQVNEIAKWFFRSAEMQTLKTGEWPGIDRTPGVCGGRPRILRTRIPVWTLAQMRRLGASDAQILDSFPTLRADDLARAWLYADAHRDAMTQQIRENEEA